MLKTALIPVLTGPGLLGNQILMVSVVIEWLPKPAKRVRSNGGCWSLWSLVILQDGKPDLHHPAGIWNLLVVVRVY
jgi:hypothetical protein